MPAPEQTDLSDSECFKALRPDLPDQRRALKAFVEALLGRLPEAERDRLVRRIIRKLNKGECTSTAVYQGLIDDHRGQKLAHLTLMACDIRGLDTFEYLAPYLVRAAGISIPYIYSNANGLPLNEILSEFDCWLQPHGLRYLHMDTGGDEYAGFIVGQAQIAHLIELAKAADIPVSLQSF
ncbi:DUF6630 family protein [Phytopseudomonas flavescens]|nr:hypothetical protein [Pseudomonas flavescens]